MLIDALSCLIGTRRSHPIKTNLHIPQKNIEHEVVALEGKEHHTIGGPDHHIPIDSQDPYDLIFI
jgi:hypothetical protein